MSDQTITIYYDWKASAATCHNADNISLDRDPLVWRNSVYTIDSFYYNTEGSDYNYEHCYLNHYGKKLVDVLADIQGTVFIRVQGKVSVINLGMF